MKKLVLVVCLLSIIALVSACKTHERCAAYGKYGSVEVKSMANKA